MQTPGTAGLKSASHACRRSTPEQRRRWDLSNLQFIMSGAEPIKVHTMTAFFTTFAECGLKPSVFCSAYGLAEHVCGMPHLAVFCVQ